MTPRVVGLTCLLAGALPSLLPAQEQGQGQARNCVVVVDSMNRFNQRPIGGGATAIYAGGGVLGHCLNQPTTLASDSMEWFSSAGELHLIGRARFRDSTEALDADRITYWTRIERVYAEGRVFARNVHSASELRGPNMDYYRAVPPIRDTLDLLANGRPVIRLHSGKDSTGAADTTNPFVIVADRVKLRHTNRFWGSGHVTIDRRDLNARGDSSSLSTADSVGWLVGAARVVGHDTTRAPGDTTATYTLVGQRIRFDLDSHQDVKRVRSFGDADATGQDWRLTADTIDMDVDSNQIQRAHAHGKEHRPVAVSGLSTVTADSLDILMPHQVMQLVWAFRLARAVSRSDSAAPDSDWITGDSLRATFVRVDSAGVKRSDVDRVDSYGSARALYHTDNPSDPRGTRGINYSRGRRIDIAMREHKVRVVDIVGQVDGVYLEPIPPVDTTKADSLRADSLRDSTRSDTTRRDTARAQRPRPEGRARQQPVLKDGPAAPVDAGPGLQSGRYARKPEPW